MKPSLLILLCSHTLLVGASDIDNFTAATNDRFANDPSFIGTAYDFSGVGKTTQGGDGRWATLIADNIYLTSSHNRAFGNVTFYESNDPAGVSHIRSSGVGQQIGSTDLYIYALTSPLPSSIARYAFPTVDLSAPVVPLQFASPEFAYAPGLTPSSGGYANNDLTKTAVGENRIEFYADDVDLTIGATVVSTTDSLYYIQNEPGDVGYTYETHESSTNPGDSGAPLFSLSGGDLLLQGIAGGEGIVTILEGDRNASIYSYLGNYDSEIQTFIDANLIAIPEPSSALLIGLGGGLFILARKRR